MSDAVNEPKYKTDKFNRLTCCQQSTWQFGHVGVLCYQKKNSEWEMLKGEHSPNPWLMNRLFQVPVHKENIIHMFGGLNVYQNIVPLIFAIFWNMSLFKNEMENGNDSMSNISAKGIRIGYLRKVREYKSLERRQCYFAATTHIDSPHRPIWVCVKAGEMVKVNYFLFNIAIVFTERRVPPSTYY